VCGVAEDPALPDTTANGTTKIAAEKVSRSARFISASRPEEC
jgi:hypothetical protein